MKITDKFILFFSKNDMMSNFYPIRFKHQKHMFSNSEQAFMWRKAMFFKDYEIAHRILTKAHQPNYAKSLGRKVKNFDNEKWDKARYEIMKEVVKDKINQFDELKTFIKNNKDKTFVEASPYDSIWGVKLSENDDKILDPSNWKGQNLLGKVYNELKKEI